MGKLLVTALAGSLLLAGCARWDSVGGSYPHKSSLLPNSQIKLSETISYSLEKIVLTGAGAWILYNIYDPLAPNWEVVEAKVADNVYVLDLKMKRFHTGGSGEAMMVIKRRAEQLRRENGFASYRVVDYVEGIESSTPIAQRYAQGLVQMARSNP
ncbi:MULTISPECIES: hypothetical protein [Azospira]|uniref:Uncharacterized protein n=1 Tax=Azospira oryzae (strain ATCC BAA-33 / DSM 13638 / PS) TaxID=640081 RepID=G8QG55_AZOOP|nr:MULTISPECIES: hypothetical protein [Azospira]AEV26128.1 hypothetical protein Dsui_1743 [Azospira oryzae PS]MDK9690396.1 hypothetical protein [Azospira sp.]